MMLFLFQNKKNRFLSLSVLGMALLIISLRIKALPNFKTESPASPPPQWNSIPDSGKPYNTILKNELDTLIQRAKLNGKVGITVISNKYQRYEIRKQDQDWFTPASTQKVLVTGAALHNLSADFYPETHLSLSGKKQGTLFQGVLKIKGQGDPNISNRFFTEPLAPFQAWADSIKHWGVDTLKVQIDLDTQYITDINRPEIWKEKHFNKWFGAEISALSFNDNCFGIRVSPGEKIGLSPIVQIYPPIGFVKVQNKAKTVSGKRSRIKFYLDNQINRIILKGTIGKNATSFKRDFPIRNPKNFFKAAMLHSFSQKGLTIIETALAPPKDSVAPKHPLSKPWKSITWRSAPLTNLIREINQMSQNLHAELLLRILGAEKKQLGTRIAGIHVLKDFLNELQLDTNDFQILDGSGLSHLNKIKPFRMAQYLSAMLKHPAAPLFVESMATPGIDGLASIRLNKIGQAHYLKLKTGHIDKVQGLLGYVFGLDGDTLSVSILINDYQKGSWSASKLADSLMNKIAHWYNKENSSLSSLRQLHHDTDTIKSYSNRLQFFSKKLLGKPYFLGPTGEGRFGLISSSPLADFNQFDCVTYIESVMSLAETNHSLETLDTLQKIRYHNGSISYSSRNHYFIEDWIKSNSNRVQLLKLPGSIEVRKEIYKDKFYQSKKLPAPKINPELAFPMLPLDSAIKLASDWSLGKGIWGIAFATHIKGLDVTHTGFVTVSDSIPYLRHASSRGKKIVREERLINYLKSRKSKCPGIVLFKFLKV